MVQMIVHVGSPETESLQWEVFVKRQLKVGMSHTYKHNTRRK